MLGWKQQLQKKGYKKIVKNSSNQNRCKYSDTICLEIAGRDRKRVKE
jgi:hypothetical protein